MPLCGDLPGVQTAESTAPPSAVVQPGEAGADEAGEAPAPAGEGNNADDEDNEGEGGGKRRRKLKTAGRKVLQVGS